jgi:hypothetical protein
MMKRIADLLFVLALSTLFISCKNNGRVASGPDPIFEKPAPITMGTLKGTKIHGVQAYEVSDYSPAHYNEKIPNTRPHADHNPHRSVIIKWQKYPGQMFVFNHEASYTPWMELLSGLGLCNQFFEGNDGYAELFNENGRRERNSFVDIVRSGPEDVWVRWNYFCVNVKSDSLPALRGTEDYVAYPNGLLWRRLTYTSLMPGSHVGYSWQPIDFFAVAPNGTEWKDLFPRDDQHNDYFISSVIDIYSDKQYDIFWDDQGKARRNGSNELLWDISKSRGMAMVMTSREGYLFVLFGASSGFPVEKNQIVDHSFPDNGGWDWGAVRWDHWPVGWLNAQTNEYKPGSKYPYHFGPLSHFWVSSKIVKPGDYDVNSNDMEHNRWSEKHVYYTLSGVARDMETIREVGRKWLDKGSQCTTPESVEDLR